MPAHSPGGSPAPAGPIISFSPRWAPPVGETGHGRWRTPPPPPQTTEMCADVSRLLRWRRGVPAAERRNAGTFVRDPSTPLPPPSFRKCSQLNPGGSAHRSTHSLPPARPARSPLSLQQLFTSWSPLPLSDPPSVFTPLVGTSGRVSEVRPIHHASSLSAPGAGSELPGLGWIWLLTWVGQFLLFPPSLRFLSEPKQCMQHPHG